MRFSNKILIHREVGNTFTFVSNISNIPKWNHSVRSCVKVSEGAIQAGATYKLQRRFLGKILEDIFVVSKYETNKILTISSIQAAYPFVVTYIFESHGQSTLLVNEFNLEAKRLMRFFEFMLRSSVKRAVASNLIELKNLVENDR
jgi:hypothetical protein